MRVIRRNIILRYGKLFPCCQRYLERRRNEIKTETMGLGEPIQGRSGCPNQRRITSGSQFQTRNRQMSVLVTAQVPRTTSFDSGRKKYLKDEKLPFGKIFILH